jgi:hypothetical protein
MDAEHDDMASGIQACLAKNGENTPTANLPMGTYKHTGVGNAAARDQYAAAGQIQDGGLVYAADSGAADAYVIAPSPAITAYAAGQGFRVKIANANTGACTINVSGVGAKSIKRPDGNDPSADDMIAGQIAVLIYDGTNFQLTNPATDADTGDVVGPGSSTDGGMVLFDGTGGKTLKESTITGIVKSASGVPSAATAGTDFAKPDTASSWSAEQTFKELKETVYALSGTTPALDPANGTIQTWTLSGNSTPTDSLEAGQSLTLLIDDGTAYTITWPSVTWLTDSATAPTLKTSGYTTVELLKVGSTLYGYRAGDGG